MTAGNDSGLWSEKDGALKLVLREGSQAPGAPAGAFFAEMVRGTWNASGSLALKTSLQTVLAE